MKRLPCLMLWPIFASVAIADPQRLPLPIPQEGQAQLSVHVVDEAGAAVAGAPIGATTTKLSVVKEARFPTESSTVRSMSDASGLAVLRAPSVTGGFWVGIQPCDEFYQCIRSFEYHFQPMDADKKWQPWNPTIEITVRRKGNPIPLYAKKIGYNTKPFVIPVGRKLGFDLVIGDAVGPGHRGKVSDFVFEVGGSFKDGSEYDSRLTVSFSNPADGFQPFAKTWDNCQLTAPREAPESGYLTPLVLRRKSVTGQLDGERLDDTRTAKGWFFRLRTVLGADGKVERAYYAKVTGAFEFSPVRPTGSGCCFTYHLNPTVNERNLEFDPKRNLHADLTSWEHVTQP